MKGNFAAIVLIAVGVFWLLTNLGLINVSILELAKTWWPLILIVLGGAMFITNRGKKD